MRQPTDYPQHSGSSAPQRRIPQEALEAARRLLGCYRTGDAHDPEIYISAVVAVLASYPVETMQHVCDPVRGLPGRLKFLPTVAEVREACEDHYGPIRRAEERREREELYRRSLPPPIEDRGQRPSYEDLVARCRRDGLDIGPASLTTRDDRAAAIATLREKFGATDEQLAAIPDARRNDWGNLS